MRNQRFWAVSVCLLLCCVGSRTGVADEPLTLDALNKADQAVALSIWQQETVVNELKAIQYTLGLIRQASAIQYQLQGWKTYRNRQAIEWTKWRMGGGADANNSYDRAIYELVLARTREDVALQVVNSYRNELKQKVDAIKVNHPNLAPALKPMLDAVEKVALSSSTSIAAAETDTVPQGEGSDLAASGPASEPDVEPEPSATDEATVAAEPQATVESDTAVDATASDNVTDVVTDEPQPAAEDVAAEPVDADAAAESAEQPAATTTSRPRSTRSRSRAVYTRPSIGHTIRRFFGWR